MLLEKHWSSIRILLSSQESNILLWSSYVLTKHLLNECWSDISNWFFQESLKSVTWSTYFCSKFLLLIINYTYLYNLYNYSNIYTFLFFLTLLIGQKKPVLLLLIIIIILFTEICSSKIQIPLGKIKKCQCKSLPSS